MGIVGFLSRKATVLGFAVNSLLSQLASASSAASPLVRRASGVACLAMSMATVVVISTPATAAPQIAQACGNPGIPGPVQHVIWIWMENESYSNVIGNSNAPYQNALAKQCGLPTNFHNESHGSLNNYIAATSGQNVLGTSFINDCTPNPAANYCVSSGPSIFSQVAAAGKTWRSYAEDMPSNCYRGTSGNYIAQHNPAVYFTSLTTCGQYDIPMGAEATQTGQFYSDVASGNLPSFSFITPNLIDDAHSSSTATADTWLSKIVPLITSGPNYQSGNTVLFITNDEGIGPDYTLNENCASQTLDANQPSCSIPTIVVAPYVPAGTVDNTFYTHYSMLRTTEELLGLPLLGLAATANSMTSNFGLGTVSGSLPPPGAPGNLTASATSSGQVHLSWTAAAPGGAPISGYKISRNGTVIGTTAGAAVTYTDTTAGPGETYSYAVSAVDSAGDVSGPSNTATVTTPAVTNLLTNPGFETWSGGLPVGWTTYGAHTTLTQSSDAHSGSSSVLVATTASGNAAAGIDDGSTPTVDSTVAGTTYTASCWVKASKIIPITVELAERQHNFTLVSPVVTTTLTVPTTTSWYQLAISDTATGNGNMMPFYTFTTAASGGGAFEADDCSLSAS
jgi:phosphatidylinositol-3-phosphatase